MTHGNCHCGDSTRRHTQEHCVLKAVLQASTPQDATELGRVVPTTYVLGLAMRPLPGLIWTLYIGSFGAGNAQARSATA